MSQAASSRDDAPSSELTVVVAAPRDVVEKRALFREQAAHSHLTVMREPEMLRGSPPWARGILLVASLLVAAAIASAFVVRVEQTGRARGVLRVPGGVQAITAQTSGLVLEVDARSGDVVAPNALLAKIDSSATKAALLEADREITRAEEDVAGFVARRDKGHARRIALLQERIGLLSRRAENQRATVARLGQRLATYDKLVDAGVTSALDRGTVENERAAGERDQLQLAEEISATRLQISNIAADLDQELERRAAALNRARDRRDALAFQLQQTEVRSPRGGRLEAFVPKVGDTVAVGTPIARLVPEGAPRQVVVFLPEADRAFLGEGSVVRVELDQLPAGEFGSLRTRVVRVAADLATTREIAETLGDAKIVEGPTFRVELALEDAQTTPDLQKLLRPGSLVTARFVLRKRRLATVLFQPLKRFFD